MITANQKTLTVKNAIAHVLD